MWRSTAIIGRDLWNPNGPPSKHGSTQAVRFPKEFRIRSKEMRSRRVGRSVRPERIVEPVDVAAWFAKLDEYLEEPFMPEGRRQPLMPPPHKPFA
jgi:virulence-associated protein VagC